MGQSRPRVDSDALLPGKTRPVPRMGRVRIRIQYVRTVPVL